MALTGRFTASPPTKTTREQARLLVLACTATENPPLKSVPGCEGPQVFYDYFKISNRKEIKRKNSFIFTKSVTYPQSVSLQAQQEPQFFEA